MSKLLSKREELKAQIVAANIGWTADQIVLKRQADLWNDIATAMSTAENGLALHIGFASGKADDPDEGLEIELSLVLTIVASPQPEVDASPEEAVWEELVQFVHDLQLGQHTPYAYRLRFQSFEDIEIAMDETQYLARQTTFAMKFSL